VNRLVLLCFILLAACGKKADKDTGGSGAATDKAVDKVVDKANEAADKATDMAGKATDMANKAVDKAADMAGKAADKVKAVAATGAALTADEYEKLVLGLSSCQLKGYSIDSKCDAAVALQDRLKNSKTNLRDLLGGSAKLGQKLISNEAPAVRVKAAQLMASFTGTTADSQNTIVEAAAKEKDPQVLQAFIRTVSNDGAKNPKVGEMLLAAADHADTDVRLQAVYALSSSWNRDLTKGAEKLAAMADKDADGKVRQAACKYGGKLGNKVMLPVIKKLTAKPDADLDLYSACMQGLGEMFHQYPFYETTDKNAYDLFLQRLSARPRGKGKPPWLALGLFQYTNSETNDKLKAWKAKATWFKPAAVRKVLGSIVTDKDADYLARTSSVDSLVGLSASKAELEGLKKKVEDTQVIRKLDEAIAKSK